MIIKLRIKYLFFSTCLILVSLIFFSFDYQSNTLKKEIDLIEYDKLIHLNANDYKFILNPGYSICGASYTASQKILLIAIVIIAPDLFEQRNLIRETWGSLARLNKNFKLVFSLGLSETNAVNGLIKKESIIYKDIIQKSFIDSYYNLTFKVMESLKWSHEYCSNSYFTLRINDDVVVNTYALLDYLNVLKENQNNQLICLKYHQSKPIRNRQSKFYISYDVFNQTYYDDYCEGSAYVIASNLNKKIYDYSLNFNYKPFSIWLEDVYVGMIAKRLNINIVDITWKFVPINQYWSVPSWFKYFMIGKDTLFVYHKDMSFIWSKFKQ